MKKRGEIVLGLAGMSPKKPYASKDAEGDEDDMPGEGEETETETEDAEELPMVAVTAAEDLCRDLGIDEGKADAVARAIRKICM